MMTKALLRDLHILTYDVRGHDTRTGQPRAVRQTGLVTHTHNLIKGLAERSPNIRIAVTYTGHTSDGLYKVVTPEGVTVRAQGIRTDFPAYLADHVTGGKDRHAVTSFYETQINDPVNPVYHSLAQQYSRVISSAGSSMILAQNPNSIVGMLKMEEFGYLDEVTIGQINLTGVIHDIAQYPERLSYVARRSHDTKMNFKLIAISRQSAAHLASLGFSEERLHHVTNGVDVNRLLGLAEITRQHHTFESIRARNDLPHGRLVFVSARRVEHKGQVDVIGAIESLVADGLTDLYVAFSGANMLDSRALAYEEELRTLVKARRLEQHVFFLDELTDIEVVACYGAAVVSILASTEPEGFGYANIEAMLAGTPIIASRMGGPLDYLDDGRNSILVPPSDPGGIARALRRVTGDEALATSLSRAAASDARKYTLERMAAGYTDAILRGTQRLPFLVRPGRPFFKVGTGMHTDVYTRAAGHRHVYQVFRDDRTDLSVHKVRTEYDYLKVAYAAMPQLVPRQRLFLAKNDDDLRNAVLVKSFVEQHPRFGNLLAVTASGLPQDTLSQVRRFITMTRALFTLNDDDALDAPTAGLIPDVIDPGLENLVIDVSGDLRLVDTNMLIDVRPLLKACRRGNLLDMSDHRRPAMIYTLLIRRIMLLDSRFRGVTREELRQDRLYSSVVASTDFDHIFDLTDIENEQFGP